MAQNVQRRKRWYDGLPRWSSRMMVLLFVVGGLLVVFDVALMAAFLMQDSGSLWPGKSTTTATLVPQWTPTATGTLIPQWTPTATATPTRVIEPTATAVATAVATATSTEAVDPTPTPTHVAWPTATPSPTPVVIVDWRGEYFVGDLVGLPALVRNDPSINFDWGYGAPATGLPADGFSARWTREVHLSGGLYRFYALVDDGLRLYVDGNLLIDTWRDGSRRELMADLKLSDGAHAIRVEYYERSGVAAAALWWERLATYPDWKGEYWPNRELSGNPALVRNDPQIDFNWEKGSPAELISDNHFSARWTRKVAFEKGTYRFYALVDDGIRVYVDDHLVLDAWGDHDAKELVADYALPKGTYTVKVEYYERIGNARIAVRWDKVELPEYADWKAEYWPTRKLEGESALIRNDAKIDFDWGLGTASPGLPVDGFSARWTRRVYFSGRTYRFHAYVDDGIRLWVDDQLVIDAWYDHSAHEVTGDLAIVRGWHPVRVEYFDRGGDARIHVWWDETPLSFADWKGEYWPNRNLDGEPALVRNDQEVYFDWHGHAPAIGLPRDGFSARWSRAYAFQPGFYRLFAWADDGIRVYVGGNLVIDEWHGAVDEVYMTDLALEGTHQVRVEYSEHTAAARVRFWWKRVGDLPTPTPTATATPTATPSPTPTATATTEPTPTATATTEPTPTATATTEPTPTATVVPEGIRINEVLPAPESTDWDGDGVADELDEWIEIYNAGETAIDISGWLLTQGGGSAPSTPPLSSSPGKLDGASYQFPVETVLEPGAYLVLYRQKTGLVLGDGGGALKLSTAVAELVDAVAFGEVGADASYNRAEDGTWYVSPLPSPGAANIAPLSAESN
jgi:hypothetical protein